MNRLANESTIAEEMAVDQKAHKHKINFINADGDMVSANLSIKFKRVLLHPPVSKQTKYKSMKICVVSAVETGSPVDRPRIKWTFLTNLSVQSRQDANKVLGWYKQRWKVKVYFKILKSGLKAEESKLRTADRLSRLISIFCIIAWRIQWITMLNRDNAYPNPELAFDDTERKILKLYCKERNNPDTLQDYIVCLAVPVGYLNRSNDPPPGNTVIWRGLNKLYEFRSGFELALNVGN